jgi:sulfonate transport system permease protein
MTCKRLHPRLRSTIIGALIPLLLLGLWELSARFGWARPNLLPPPSAVLETLVDLARRGELWTHIETTLVRVALGFAIGTTAGTLCGALTGYSRLWRELLDPMLQGLRAIPSIAWVPLFILWLGIFEAAKVTLIAVGVFFPVYLNLMAGIGDVDRRLVEVGRVYRFSSLTLVRRILVPATLPGYITGLRSGLGLGWMFVVAAEIMGASEGLGFLLIDGEQTGRPATIIASLLLFAILGKMTDVAIAQLGRRALAWQDSFGNQSTDARDQGSLQTI